jgi:predicted GNAT family acetyltransferase
MDCVGFKLDNISQLVEYSNPNIRWLDIDHDFELIAKYYEECGAGKIIKEDFVCDQWKVCAVIINNKIVSYAGALFMTQKNWEIGAVSTLASERNKGYAKATTSFIARYILENGKQATLDTSVDNEAMKKVAKQIGMVVQ